MWIGVLWAGLWVAMWITHVGAKFRHGLLEKSLKEVEHAWPLSLGCPPTSLHACAHAVLFCWLAWSVGPEEAQRLIVGADATVAQDRRALRVRAKMWGAGVLVKPPAPWRPMAKAEGIVAAPAIPKVRAEVFWPRPGPPITVEEAAARLARLTLDVPAEVGDAASDDARSENGSEDSEATLLLG